MLININSGWGKFVIPYFLHYILLSNASELPVVDLGYTRHQALSYNASLLLM